MELEGIVGRSRVIRKSLDPVWEETMVFYALVRRHVVHFQIYDWDGGESVCLKISLRFAPLTHSATTAYF